MTAIVYPSFRRSEPKATKPRTMRADGWYEYPCAACGAITRYRKRQRHGIPFYCGRCPS